ncbi:MAG: hypothetical protein CMD43_04765 [Gammaproteobacteria bacterium]|nr:hypothetical protein [Gammaproteobacteria bacterium]|tara:strand:- start:281 stop:1000 length:720 start_codon:yes stop_codon:yes gene_type:complete
MIGRNISNLIFIKWFIGVIFFLIFIFILNHLGFLYPLINNDASYITSLILLIFIYFSINVGIELYHLRERYLNISNLLSVSKNKSKKEINLILQQFLNSNHSDDQSIYTYITAKENNESSKENFEYSLTSKLNIGWLVADGLLKLGLIGTVIGFIIMLSAITEIDGFDFTMMKDMLQNMSKGMEVALYTTLSGLVSSVLLSMQYSYLEHYIYKIFYMSNLCLSNFLPEPINIKNDDEEI